jgi:GTP cyclohydrolase IB
MTYINSNDLPDIQQSEPKIKMAIMEVGVENVEVPFILESKYGGFHHMVANVSMRTSLDSSIRGISMSRLLLTLKPYLDLPLKSKLIREILSKLLETVGTATAFMKFEFRLPIVRKSILSENAFPIYYKCRFEGRLYKVKVIGMDHKEQSETYFRFFEGVTVQYASYCPCSAELSCSGSEGYPHNQRSFANVLIEGDTEHRIWLEDLIELIESRIKTLPYPVIKRVDEKEIGRIAKDNPMFVEDAIREISEGLEQLPGVVDWIVKCVHEESIHTSEAIAINYKGLHGGFDGRWFI